MLGDSLQLRLQPRDTLPDESAVRLELSFSRPAKPDTAADA